MPSVGKTCWEADISGRDDDANHFLHRMQSQTSHSPPLVCTTDERCSTSLRDQNLPLTPALDALEGYARAKVIWLLGVLTRVGAKTLKAEEA